MRKITTVDIDAGRRKKDYRIYLSKPNKEIISNLSEAYEGKYNIKLGAVNEIKFKIPYYKTYIDKVEDNSNIELIKQKMYLKVEYNNDYEWMIIDELEDIGEGDEKYLEVTAYTNVYENSHRMINGLELDTVNPEGYYGEVLDNTSWTLGIVDPMFKEVYRSFDISNSSALEAIIEGAEVYGAVLDFDTKNKKVNLFDLEKRSQYRGLKINYKNFLQSINRKSTVDEMTTRLYAYGADDLDISRVNPTGMLYLEDFSYFIYPFKRDEDKNVLEKSYYMSDELCHGLLDLGELTEKYLPQIQDLQEQVDDLYSELVRVEIELSDREFELSQARGLLDIAKAVEDADLIKRRRMEVAKFRTLVDEQRVIVDSAKDSVDNMERKAKNLQDKIAITSLSKELIDELNPYIIEKEFKDDRYINEEELYEDAKKHFEESRMPSIEIESSIDNIINSLEDKYYKDKIRLGDIARITSKEMRVDTRSVITEVSFDMDGKSHEITIANDDIDSDGFDRILTILYDTQSTTTQLANNKHKWDAVSEVKSRVDQMRDSAIDATKNRIYAGVNESVEIGDRGIVVTNPDFPEEMIIMQAGVIALSKDSGENWSTSVSPDGVVADTVIGKLIAGNNLLITNDSGTFEIDSDGLEVDMDSIKIMSGEGDSPENIIDSWNNILVTMDEFGDNNKLNEYEKNQIEKQFNSIKRVHSSMVKVAEDAYEPGDDLPAEYSLYIEAYEQLRKYLTEDIQEDGYAILDKSNRKETTTIDGELYTEVINNYELRKESFQTVLPLDFSQTYLEVLKDSISLNYVQNSEIISKLNVSEEGVQIDGKYLEVNAETEFNDNMKMNAGLILSKEEDIMIDLNKGEMNLEKPLTIKSRPVATEDFVGNVEVGGRNLVLNSDK